MESQCLRHPIKIRVWWTAASRHLRKCHTPNEILTIRNYRYITRNPFRCFAYPHPSRTGNQAKSGSGASGPNSQDLNKDYKRNMHTFWIDSLPLKWNTSAYMHIKNTILHRTRSGFLDDSEEFRVHYWLKRSIYIGLMMTALSRNFSKDVLPKK